MTNLTIPNLTAEQISSLQSQLCPTGPTGPTAPTGPTGPTAAWPPACATKWLAANWADFPHRYLPSDYGGFAPDDILVVRFTTGNVLFAGTTKYAKISSAEWVSSPSWRIFNLADAPCVFPADTGSYPTSLTTYFQVGTVENLKSSPKILLPNKTYYLNVKNAPNAQCRATGGCDLFFDFAKPAGT